LRPKISEVRDDEKRKLVAFQFINFLVC